jgi:Zn-dependent protease with chaperone function
MLISLLLSPLNRRLEVRADVEGAALGGDAQAVAEALIVAYSISDETRDRLYGRPPWRWLLAPLSWRMPTHPPLDVRIARLSRIG